MDTCKKTKPENDFMYKSVYATSRWASKTTGYSGYYLKSLAEVTILAMNAL
jgi:hypothetical protein